MVKHVVKPNSQQNKKSCKHNVYKTFMVGVTGFEPAASWSRTAARRGLERLETYIFFVVITLVSDRFIIPQNSAKRNKLVQIYAVICKSIYGINFWKLYFKKNIFSSKRLMWFLFRHCTFSIVKRRRYLLPFISVLLILCGRETIFLHVSPIKCRILYIPTHSTDLTGWISFQNIVLGYSHLFVLDILHHTYTVTISECMT